MFADLDYSVYELKRFDILILSNDHLDFPLEWRGSAIYDFSKQFHVQSHFVLADRY